MYETTPFFYGTGRRKKSIARVKTVIRERELKETV